MLYFHYNGQGPASQKIVNRTITDLSYDHLPTKFATVSQNLSDFFCTIYDLWFIFLLNIVILLVYVDTKY